MLPPVVVGAGPCGLAAGAMLHRAGYDLTVYDRGPDLDPTDVGVVVGTGGMRVLDHLGLAGTVTEAGQPLDRLRVLDANGRTVTWLDFESFEGRTFGRTPVSVDRRALLERLRTALPSAAVEHGRTCTGVAHQSGREQVQFDDGEAVVTSLVVGADGLRSTVRASMFPEGQLRATGWQAYRGLAAARFESHLRSTAWQVWGPAARVDFAAVGPERVGWTAVVRGAVGPDGDPARIVDGLVDRCVDWPEPVPTLFARTTPDAVTVDRLADVGPIDRWHGHGLVLAGDAAHATLPGLWQGVGSALVDAYALAGRLRIGDSVVGALEAYEADRKPVADWTARRTRQLLAASTVGRPSVRRVRNAVIRLLPASSSRRWRRRLAAIA